MGSKGVADFPLSKSGESGSLVSSRGYGDAVGFGEDAGRGATAVGSHDFESMLDGEERLDRNDDPRTAGVHDGL